MTKRIIDADAFLEWAKEKDEHREYLLNIDDSNFEIGYLYPQEIIDKINELASPTPEPRESIFDADGWCSAMDLAPTDGSEFIGYDNNEKYWFVVHYYDGNFTDDNKAKTYIITKWKHLLTSPKKD